MPLNRQRIRMCVRDIEEPSIASGDGHSTRRSRIAHAASASVSDLRGRAVARSPCRERSLAWGDEPMSNDGWEGDSAVPTTSTQPSNESEADLVACFRPVRARQVCVATAKRCLDSPPRRSVDISRAALFSLRVDMRVRSRRLPVWSQRLATSSITIAPGASSTPRKRQTSRPIDR